MRLFKKFPIFYLAPVRTVFLFELSSKIKRTRALLASHLKIFLFISDEKCIFSWLYRSMSEQSQPHQQQDNVNEHQLSQHVHNYPPQFSLIHQQHYQQIAATTTPTAVVPSSPQFERIHSTPPSHFALPSPGTPLNSTHPAGTNDHCCEKCFYKDKRTTFLLVTFERVGSIIQSSENSRLFKAPENCDYPW